MAEVVGQRLQAVRKFYGWSQRELAKRAGVPNSAISVIEQGTVSPSVSSLVKVLRGFPMSLVDFFSISMSQPACKVIPSAVTLKDGAVFSLHATYASRDKSNPEGSDIRHYSAVQGEVIPNRFIHKDALLLVIEGDVLLHTISVDQELGMGDSVSFYSPLPFRLEVLSEKASWVLATV